ncbi:nitrate reductase [Vibrio astriarenae]|uniref:Nitrate reductase n=1 Tax=Vibrio astriarenae TaxID=1481923 RepID=A0A7Z2T3E7_9VIBR|nr:nucleotidyltransferase family protein [Vibrio astriarenae]QIA63443.1 nitrate reductase [Vibrio astriarenae]
MTYSKESHRDDYYSKQIIKLIRKDRLRLEALYHVYHLGLPDCYIAAGFVRNLVWDFLHNYNEPTALNDVDVIYFDTNETDSESTYEKHLKALMPNVNWQVRNQARMNERNGDAPYNNSLDAMSYWPEKETAVAVRMLYKSEIECISAFGFHSLFESQLTHNAKRTFEVFESRLTQKGWLKQWPLLHLADAHDNLKSEPTGSL